jgi:hypothetical protein
MAVPDSACLSTASAQAIAKRGISARPIAAHSALKKPRISR